MAGRIPPAPLPETCRIADLQSAARRNANDHRTRVPGAAFAGSAGVLSACRLTGRRDAGAPRVTPRGLQIRATGTARQSNHPMAVYLERRAPSRLEGNFQFKLAEAVLGAPFGKRYHCQPFIGPFIGLDFLKQMPQKPSHNNPSTSNLFGTMPLHNRMKTGNETKNHLRPK